MINTPALSLSPAKAVALATIFGVGIFVLDLTIELDVAATIPYILVVWVMHATQKARDIWIAAAICTLLSMLGYMLSPEGGELWKVLANRLLGLMAIWLTAILCLRNLTMRNAIVELTSHNKVDEANAKLAAIIESSGEAFYTRALDDVITTWSSGAEQLFGYSAEEIVGQPTRVLVPESLQGDVDDINALLTLGRQVKNFETLLTAKDGGELEVSITCWPVFDTTGAVTSCSVMCREISAHKRWERSLQKLNTELKHSNCALEQSNTELQQFAYIASHDLQAPLRHISGFVELLQRAYQDKLDDTANEWIKNIVNSTERMQALIRDLLSYAKVESHSIPFETVSLNDVVSEVEELLQSSVSEVNAQITRNELPDVIGDRTQLVQLLQNLIDNGIKYCKNRVPLVQVAAEKNDDGWQIAVSDNGIGIDEEYRRKIFEIFRRLHDQQKYPGTGIGLAICRRIVLRHGGRIWAEPNNSGEGTTFCFTLSNQQNNEAPFAE